MGLERGPRGAGVVVTENDVLVHEVADGLNAAPSRANVFEHVPGDLTQSVRLAVAAAQQIDEAIVRQFRDRDFGGILNDRVRGPVILDRAMLPDREIPGRSPRSGERHFRTDPDRSLSRPRAL
jgi:hypothetical protein